MQEDLPSSFSPFPDFSFSVECWRPLFLGYFFYSPPDGKSSLTGELALSKHCFKTPVQAMECCAGFLGVRMTQGLSSPCSLTSLLPSPVIFTHVPPSREFPSMPQKHFSTQQVGLATLLPVWENS